MANYLNADSLWTSAVESCLTEGKVSKSRHGECHEVIGWSGTLLDIDRAWVCSKVRGLDAKYASAEYLHTLAHSDALPMMEAYAPNYGQYAGENGKLSWAYGYRMGYQIHSVVNQLRKTPESRQAIIQIWRKGDLISKEKYVPCSLSWQFILRDSKLSMIANLRSQDVWLGMPYDIFVATMIQRIIAGDLGVGLGIYRHNVGSLHVYDKHTKNCYKALETFDACDSKPLRFKETNHYGVEAAIYFEEKIRTREILDYASAIEASYHGLDAVHQDIVACCARKFNVSLPLKSPALKEANP
jgi:thymidylate synthase